MNKKTLLLTLIPTLTLSYNLANAEGGFKYKKLDLADPPCLFLLNEDTGQPTGNPVNTPCELGGTAVPSGGTVDAKMREQFGKIAEQPAIETTSSPSKATDYNSSRSNKNSSN